jgi:SPP1 gp7 family putative phage head morphogenesis protein
MSIYRSGNRFRRALLRGERKAAGEMVRSYGLTWRRIKEELDTLLAQIAEAKDEISLAWLLRQERLELLQRQVEAELRRWADMAEPGIVELQREAVEAAQLAAEADTRAAMGTPPPGVTLTWARLSREAVTDLVGFASDGSPLRALLDGLGYEASQAVRDALITGIATGENPRSVARRIRKAFGGNLVRALRVCRTETMRAYRTAALRNYRANDDVVKGWRWLSARDGRTCAACWAMDGTTHDLDDELHDHPNGRCVRAPWVKTWQELGFEGIESERKERETGPEAFDRLTPEEQDKILGATAGKAYRAGEFGLRDVVGIRRSAKWGRSVRVRSLKEVLGEERAQLWRAARRSIRDEDIARAAERIVDLHAAGGGSTYNLFTGDQAGQQLYAVSPFTDEGEKVRGKELMREDVEGYIRRYLNLLLDPRNNVGTWYNEADGFTYLDISITLPDRALAEKVGREFNQIAIFDLKNFDEINVGGMGDGLPEEMKAIPAPERLRWIMDQLRSRGAI